MNETVSVEEALSRGHKMVTYPGMLLMISLFAITIYLGSMQLFPDWFWAVAILLSFVTPWLYWSVMITKWRLWAFENVRNVHELKKRAIIEKLIWPDHSFFEKTEIRSASDKQKWEMLQEKFKVEDVFIEDLTIPAESLIYFSKGKTMIEIAIMLGCLGFGFYTIFEADNLLLGGIFTVAGGFYGYKSFKNLTNKKPQVIINEKGIQTISTPFFEWNDIENEEVIRKNSGKYTHYYLSYAYPGGHEKLQIDDLEVNYKRMTKLLILYRGRYKNRNKHW